MLGLSSLNTASHETVLKSCCICTMTMSTSVKKFLGMERRPSLYNILVLTTEEK